ncbi:hypothetical protein IAT38_006597 [Cryptococcus sp. DSM 104549]
MTPPRSLRRTASPRKRPTSTTPSSSSAVLPPKTRSAQPKLRSQPPAGLQLGTVIHQQQPTPGAGEAHSPDPLAFSEGEAEEVHVVKGGEMGLGRKLKEAERKTEEGKGEPSSGVGTRAREQKRGEGEGEGQTRGVEEVDSAGQETGLGVHLGERKLPATSAATGAPSGSASGARSKSKAAPAGSSAQPATTTPKPTPSRKTPSTRTPRSQRTAPAASSAAGPSQLASASANGSEQAQAAGTPTDTKGKGKTVERRVLPARIRRAAGGGAEGMREVEEMIVDWLERWGEPSTNPPDNLPVHLTTLPLDLVSPPTTNTGTSQPSAPAITLTPSRNMPERVDAEGEAKLAKEERIETPSWVMVKAGEDDEWEAKEELEMVGLGAAPVAGKGKAKALLSPVKRLRKGGHGGEPEEDTSDAYYAQLHRKYEAFERRQRIREKETLQFERHKMRGRIDLLRNMSPFSWSSVLNTILARSPNDWVKGREKIKEKGADWLKARLVREGEEVMKRYEELLPAEHRKKPNQPSGVDHSRLSTPSRLSEARSISPHPAVLPARVAALRDPAVSSSSKRKRGRHSLAEERDDVDEEYVDTPSKRAVKSNGSKGRAQKQKDEDEAAYGGDEKKAGGTAVPARRSSRSSKVRTPDPTASSQQPPFTSHPPLAPTAITTSQASSPSTPFYPPMTLSGLPCLVEAASRRETSLEDAALANVRSADRTRKGRSAPLEKTRASRRLEMTSPFGLPVPGVVECKSEFTLTDEEEFWPIIAGREEHANQERRASLLLNAGGPCSDATTASGGSSSEIGGPKERDLTGGLEVRPPGVPSEAADVEMAEAAVVGL